MTFSVVVSLELMNYCVQYSVEGFLEIMILDSEVSLVEVQGHEDQHQEEKLDKILMNMWRLVLKKQCLGLKKILIYVDILLAMLAKELGQKIHPAYKHVQLAMELDRFEL